VLIFKQGEDLWSDLARRDRRRAGSDQGDPRSRPGALGLMRSLEAVDEEVGEFPDYALGVHTDRIYRGDSQCRNFGDLNWGVYTAALIA
jgi:hypothetical protein